VNVRRLHRLLGILLLLPLCAWVTTAAIFFLKPGYGGAYDMISVRALPLTALPSGPLPSDTLEARMVRTVLGDHLLVRTAAGWSNDDPATLRPRPTPSPAEVQTLIADAIRGKARYGEVVAIHGLTATTSTGVEITLDWDTLLLQQRGHDTDRIDLFYKIHYLQWTGVKAVDRVLGAAGLAALLLLTLFGIRLAFGRA
jgi:hypothetical protein